MGFFFGIIFSSSYLTNNKYGYRQYQEFSFLCERERERERERRGRGGQTDRLIDKKQRETETGRQTDIMTQKERARLTDKQTERKKVIRLLFALYLSRPADQSIVLHY